MFKVSASGACGYLDCLWVCRLLLVGVVSRGEAF